MHAIKSTAYLKLSLMAISPPVCGVGVARGRIYADIVYGSEVYELQGNGNTAAGPVFAIAENSLHLIASPLPLSTRALIVREYSVTP